MNYPQEVFLRTLFKKLNLSFSGKWCVLHSYETLPYYSDSDVDMALSGNLLELEKLIRKTAALTGWEVYQKLWYDIPHCFYYVLRDEDNNYLAIDFLIDKDGIGKYGFSTKLLTKKCNIFKETIPIPNHEIAFSYKLIKRLVKKRSLIEDKAYLKKHFALADKTRVYNVLESHLGKSGTDLILKKIADDNFDFSKIEIIDLHNKLLSNRSKSMFFKVQYWKMKRIFNRVRKPRGLIVYTPVLQDERLDEFELKLRHKVNLLFRYVRKIDDEKFHSKFTGLVGSTLIIVPTKGFQGKKAFKRHWLSGSRSEFDIEKEDFSEISFVVDKYFNEILKLLKSRKW